MDEVESENKERTQSNKEEMEKSKNNVVAEMIKDNMERNGIHGIQNTSAEAEPNCDVEKANCLKTENVKATETDKCGSNGTAKEVHEISTNGVETIKMPMEKDTPVDGKDFSPGLTQDKIEVNPNLSQLSTSSEDKVNNIQVPETTGTVSDQGKSAHKNISNDAAGDKTNEPSEVSNANKNQTDDLAKQPATKDLDVGLNEAQTAEQHTAKQRTAEQHTAEQHTAETNTAEQHTAEKNTAEQHTAEQHTAEQNTAEQHTAETNTAEQNTAEQQPAALQTTKQRTAEQQTAEQHTAEQQTAEQHTAEQNTAEQNTTEQHTAEQHTAEQQTAEQHTAEQDTAEQQTAEQQTTKQQTKEKQTKEKQTAKELNATDVDLKEQTTKELTMKGLTAKDQDAKEQTTEDQTVNKQTVKELNVKEQTVNVQTDTNAECIESTMKEDDVQGNSYALARSHGSDNGLAQSICQDGIQGEEKDTKTVEECHVTLAEEQTDEHNLCTESAVVNPEEMALSEQPPDTTKQVPQCDPVMSKVIRGNCPIDSLPALNKKAVRIFISSTFTDTKEERNVLMERVYPKVAEYCRDKYGLEFQVVDMRWGVPEHATENHSTTDLCLSEVRKCQELSVGPNFVVFLGNKYGYRPMPSKIPEEEFQVLKDVAQNVQHEKWTTIEEWYALDENACPKELVLLPISMKLPDFNNTDNLEKRKEAQNKWNTLSVDITRTLRDVAMEAEKQQKISSQQKHKYFMSVTENEILHGILESSTEAEHTCLCILRNIPDIKEYLTERKAPKFIDTIASDVDAEAEGYLQELTTHKISQNVPDTNLSKFEIEWKISGGNITQEKTEEINSQLINEHNEYLTGICEEFTEKITKLIDRGGKEMQVSYTRLNTEVLQHLHFAKLCCEVFEGRDTELRVVKKYLNSNMTVPMTIYGQSGCGKTSVIANIYHKINQWTAKTQGESRTIFCVLRFLGTTPSSSNLQDLLESVCEQLCSLYEKPWSQPERMSDLISAFHQLLGCASRKRPVLLLFDSIDQLSPAFNAYKMEWLPDKLPNFVKVIASSIDEDYPIVDAMRTRYEGSELIQVKPLGQEVGLSVIMKWMQLHKRGITGAQTELVRKALEDCSLPLYARIICDQIHHWKSFDPLDELRLEATIQGAINKHFEMMETKLGKYIVKHSLSYLTSARHGLSEVEMEHVLSLDDVLLNEVFQFWKPPIRRIPPLLWTRVRSEISNYIVERSADDLQVLHWYHRQFIETARQRYLTPDDNFIIYIHKNLSDFFSGIWGGGKLKPFQYTDAQKARFGLTLSDSAADRKVPKQPYFSSKDLALRRFNLRRVSELPIHLLKSKQLEHLKRKTFFCFKWIYSKLTCNAAALGVLHEIEHFMSIDKSLEQDFELQILYATLHLIRPYVNRYPASLPLELVSRLSQYIGVHPMLTRLIQQCDQHGQEMCPVIPVVTAYECADLGLKQNISVRDSEPWHIGGTLVCDAKFEHIYIIDYDDQGSCHLSTWIIKSGERVSEIPIGKAKDPDAADVYFDSFLDKKEEHIIALYWKKYYSGLHAKRSSGDGFIDIIRLQDATVTRTIQEHLYKYKFNNSMLYFTENWCAVRFGWKIPLWNLKEDKKIQLTQPHLLSKDETKFILTRSKKSGVRYFEGENKVITEAKTKSAVIRNFETKDNLGEFDKSDSMAGIAFSSDESCVFLADALGTINEYEIARLGDGKLLKLKKTLTLPRNTTVKVQIKMATDEEKQSSRTTLIISSNDRFIICVYQSMSEWEAILWNVFLGKYVARITEAQPLKARYPLFSCDAETIVLCSDTTVSLVACSTGDVLREYEQRQLIRDIYVSRTQPEIVILKGKDVSILSSTVVEANTKLKASTQTKDGESIEVLPREIVNNHSSLPALTLDLRSMAVCENPGFIAGMDLDLLSSARGQRKAALDTWITPDQNKVVQLHLRVQVVDTKADEIKYTPKTSDVILRAKTSEAGVISNEQIAMPSLNGGFKATDLLEGDRVVAEGNKIKLRVSKDQQLQVMTIPSVLIVSECRDGKMRRLHRITTYMESIQTVSNGYVATLKRIGSDQYINVYALESGSLATTHAVDGQCSCARISTNQSTLYVITKALMLRVYAGRMFFSPESRVSLDPSITDAVFTVRDIMDFHQNPTCIVIRYAEEGAGGYDHNHYTHFHTPTRKTSPRMTVKPALDDIAADGSIGVDAQLVLYDMNIGGIIQHIEYARRGPNMQIQVKLSDDKTLVVFVDKQDDTFHVVRIEDRVSSPVMSGYTHSPLMPSIGGLVLRNSGKVLVLYRQQHQLQGLFLLQGRHLEQNVYASKTDRVLALLQTS